MSWRSILISNGGKLSLQHKQMLIHQDGEKFTVPLEDIAIIVIENKETVITVPLLSALALHGITLLTCDEQYLPCGQWLPFNQYHRQLKILKLQLTISQPLKKQLWQRIVQQKIINQAVVLEQTDNRLTAEKLRKMSQRVKSGDKENIEAQAALIYFHQLFGQQFRRSEEDHSVNIHLNYAYTVLRSAVARELVRHGWLPQLGFFHRSELNPFNLADDFIEPFRPLVDLMIWHLWQSQKLEQSLIPEAKQQLIKLLHYQLKIQDQTFSVLAGIEKAIASLQHSLINKDPVLLKLPEILPLKEHEYE